MDPDKHCSRETVLEEPDVRSLVRMMGEVSGLEMGLPEKKRLLLGGLCRLIQGDGWAWSLTEQTGDRVVCLDAMSGGEELRLKTSDRDRTAQPSLRGNAKNLSGEAAHPLADNDRKTRPALSVCTLSGDTASRVVFGRRAGRPAFSAREEEMARIVTEEIDWLHEINPVCLSLRSDLHLSPRQKETIALLAQGLSRKTISERLQISPHTARDYIKTLYRTFGINSRSELILHLAVYGSHELR